MTYSKTQFKKRANNIKERLETIQNELEELQNDLEWERDDIEPYEGKDDLTDQQEERQDWLDDSAREVGYAIDSVQEAISYLEELEY